MPLWKESIKPDIGSVIVRSYDALPHEISELPVDQLSLRLYHNLLFLCVCYEPRREKTGLRVSDHVRHKLVCAATEDG